MPEPHPAPRPKGNRKSNPGFILLALSIVLVMILFQPDAFFAQINPTPTPVYLPTQVFEPTATLNPIPELNPNPRQTDGVILGAAIIIFVILAGIWTYGRRRKE